MFAAQWLPKGSFVNLEHVIRIAGLPVGLVLCLVVAAWFGRLTWRPFVLLALREAGHPVCVRCGYSMQGLGHQTMKCPECGADHDGHIAVD